MRDILALVTGEISMVSLGCWELIERFRHLAMKLLSRNCFAVFLGRLETHSLKYIQTALCLPCIYSLHFSYYYFCL
jgi:hypothetical protein